MVLRDQVDALRSQALAGLAAAHDHLSFSQSLWANRLAATRYGGRTTHVTLNVVTGSQLDDETVGPFAAAAINAYLPSAAVQQFVSLTEVFLGDLVRLWVTAHPFHLRGQIDVQTVVAAADREAVLQPLIDRYVMEMAFKSPREWFRQLNAVVSLGGVPDDGRVDAFAELKATRDVLVHGRGFANATYVRKAGPLARAADGEPIDLPDDYVSDAWQRCQALVDAVGVAAAGRA